MWNGKVSLSILIFCGRYYIVVVNLNMTGGSALSCSSLTEALFTLRLFPSRRVLSFLPTGLPTLPTLQPCIFLLNLIISLYVPHTGKLRILSGNMEAWALLCELVFLSNWKEQSSSKYLLPTKKRHSPNRALYWCFFFFFLCFTLSWLTCVEKLPFF